MSRIHVVTLGGLRIETDAGPVEALASQPVRSALLPLRHRTPPT